jgi:hypothetical protein
MPVCSGIVTRNGYPARSVRVTGSVGGFFGGMTETVYTDRDGEFILEWSTDSGLDTLYIDGSAVKRGVRKGARVHVDL